MAICQVIVYGYFCVHMQYYCTKVENTMCHKLEWLGHDYFTSIIAWSCIFVSHPKSVTTQQQ